MRSASRRDPKKFAQRTLAAAVAASALAACGITALAQTTGGGIGAAGGGNAPASPASPGAGPGVNNTGSPVLGVPANLKQPIGGNSGPRGPNGTSRLPGSTPPAPKTVPGADRNQPGSPATPGRVTPPATPTRTNRGTSTVPGNTGTPAGGAVTRRPANTSSNLRSGQITNVKGNSFTFQEGAATTTLNLTPRTVIQMNGRPIALSDIPANASVQIERSPTNANQVQRVVVTPQVSRPAAATTANSASNDLNAATPNGSLRNNDINAPTPNGSLPDSMNERLGMQMRASKGGVVVGDVTRESIAGKSGFMTGDRIESLNGRSISTPADLAQALQAGGQQGSLTARVMREGVPRDVNLSLPQGFFSTAGITGAAAGNVGVGPAVGLGGGLAVTPDGNVGVGVPVAPGVGVVVPVEGGGAVGTTAPQGAVGANVRGTASANSAQSTAAARGGATPRDGAPSGTSRSPGSLTTEALKVPDVDLGWNLKATPEGVQLTELVGGGIASRSKLEAGDIIDSIDKRPVTSPGAVSYELHRHRGGTSVDLTILRDGKRMTQRVRLPEDHQPLLMNTIESFGAANNTAKEQGATQADPAPVSPNEQSLKTLEQENRELKAEIERLKNQQP